MTHKRAKPFALDLPFNEALQRYAKVTPGELARTIERPPSPGPERSKVLDPNQGELELVSYDCEDCHAAFRLDPSNETVWATQQQIADAFGVATRTVGEHLQNIFREGELDEAAVARKFRATGPDGRNYNYLHYNLEAVLSVGYRVSSKRATHFRKWATGVLKDYIVQGFALNEARLRDDPNALRELAAKVREMRSGEKNVYAAVRDVFALASTDYTPSAQIVRTFYATLQDKFLFAITGHSAAEIIIDRADRDEPNMGLRVLKSGMPTLDEAKIGKNYLDRDELYQLHILCEQWLLFVESAALRGRKMTMADLMKRFDDLLRFQGHEVFQGYKAYLRERAVEHAKREMEAYRKRLDRPEKGAT